MTIDDNNNNNDNDNDNGNSNDNNDNFDSVMTQAKTLVDGHIQLISAKPKQPPIVSSFINPIPITVRIL